MDHTLEMYPITEEFKPGKLEHSVSMKVNLAEIWDFYLEFSDWKTSNIKDEEEPKKDMSTYLVFQMFGINVI